MYFPKAARFGSKTQQAKTQTAAPPSNSATSSSNLRGSPAKKSVVKTADEKSFENFMGMVHDSFRATQLANKAKEEYLRETEKESRRVYRTKEGPGKERLTLHGGMFVRLIGAPVCTELGPGTYEHHSESLERRGHNIMEMKKDLQEKKVIPRNKSKHSHAN
eukprot:TRINITY_DN1581_c0_g1_i8.p2 TRINITY_DN1581_c0_g1~~TRINITY_DN1581_c0_g1_i8.p2  ORF type:complete len:162 (-),score=54.80 TRINITY_DN1581_c0_g1_i8:339-824(-)